MRRTSDQRIFSLTAYCFVEFKTARATTMNHFSPILISSSHPIHRMMQIEPFNECSQQTNHQTSQQLCIGVTFVTRVRYVKNLFLERFCTFVYFYFCFNFQRNCEASKHCNASQARSKYIQSLLGNQVERKVSDSVLTPVSTVFLYSMLHNKMGVQL